MKPFRSFPASCLLLPVFSLLSCADPNAGKPYDIVITNAKIVDGTGNPWYYGDVGIRGDRIATIAPRNALTAEPRSEEHTSELQSQSNPVCRLLLEKKNVRV